MKKIFLFLFVIICLFLSLSCDNKVDLGVKEETYFVTSDLHLLSNNLVPNEEFKKKLIADGRIQEKDYQLLEAFVKEVNEKKPKFVFITGDLTFNGEKDSHEEVARILKSVNSETKVLVIPGNHDMFNQKSYTYAGEYIEEVENVDYEGFKNIYKDFGYTNAYSYDEVTLSYIYELSPKRWAIMLDTTTSYSNADGQNYVGGAIYLETYNWLKEHLEYAKAKGIEVISFSHHNMMVHNEVFKYLYAIGNYKDIQKLYNDYDVKINFSGHLHNQIIHEENGLCDIVSSCLLDYGNQYGVIDIYPNDIYYHTNKLSFDCNGQKLIDYSFDRFYQCYYDKTIKKYNEEETDIMCKLNCYYFDGNYDMIKKLVKKNRKLIANIAQFNKYIDSIVSETIENPKSKIIKMVITNEGGN